MELKLSQQESKVVLLEWAERMFPGKFNKVDVSGLSEYSTRGHTEFSFEPIAEKPEKAWTESAANNSKPAPAAAPDTFDV